MPKTRQVPPPFTVRHSKARAAAGVVFFAVCIILYGVWKPDIWSNWAFLWSRDFTPYRQVLLTLSILFLAAYLFVLVRILMGRAAATVDDKAVSWFPGRPTPLCDIAAVEVGAVAIRLRLKDGKTRRIPSRLLSRKDRAALVAALKARGR